MKLPKTNERHCFFGGVCGDWKTLKSRDPFTGETISNTVCGKCGKSINER